MFSLFRVCWLGLSTCLHMAKYVSLRYVHVKRLQFSFKGQMGFILVLVSPAFRVNHIQYFCLRLVGFSTELHVLLFFFFSYNAILLEIQNYCPHMNDAY